LVDPAVGAQIYPWIFWNQRRVTGYEGAKILHGRREVAGTDASGLRSAGEPH